jgi:uncharacterized protein (TIGR00725 family)
LGLLRKVQISVIGASMTPADADLARAAEEVGRRIAAAGATLVSGGLGGVMEAASRGARAAGGLVVGIVMDYEKETANPHCDVVVATGLGHARNVLVVASADAVVAVGGGPGTLSEIALALKLGRPVFGIRTWEIPGVAACATPAEAVERALAIENARR